MSNSDLTTKKCAPCEGAVSALSQNDAQALLAKVPGWELEGRKLKRRMKFRDFRENMRFICKMAELAEAEGHHPDFSVHYNELKIEIWTHAINGLSENDFILAAKINALS